MKLIQQKIVKFAVVGSIGFIIDFGSTFLLKEKLAVDPYIGCKSSAKSGHQTIET